MRKLAVSVSLLALTALMAVYAVPASATVTQDAINAAFELSDGNLAPLASGTNFDWNSFDPVTWPTVAADPNANPPVPAVVAPYRVSTKTVSGWVFNGLEDAQVSTKDTSFAGGVKQDKNCATIDGSKAPNKDDLKRIYIANKTLSNGHVILGLAWVRIPLNTTSSSAHVGFEFNEGLAGATCPTPAKGTTDGLIPRTPQGWGGTNNESGGNPSNPGDLLFVYDFEGGATVPHITLRHWIDANSTLQTCEIGSDPKPCWSTAVDLTDSGVAVAKVNIGDNTTTNPNGAVHDLLAPPAPGAVAPANSVDETLGLKEFGEAGIDLTQAGVFNSSTCVGFGQAEGVSRSSGNSGSAAMEDLVGPGHISISNCGTVIIRKETVPDGDTTSFGYTDNIATGPSTTTSPFSLTDGTNKTIANVIAGSYRVDEDATTGWTLTGLDCTASTVPAASITTQLVPGAGEHNVSFTIAAGKTLDCTFTNTKNKASPTADTAPSVIPQDKATVSGFDDTGSVDGLIHFELWDNSNCDTSGTPAGVLLYSETQTVTANGDYSTANPGGPTGYTISTTGEHDYWKVYYDGDTRNNTFDDGCVEDVTATLTGFTAP